MYYGQWNWDLCRGRQTRFRAVFLYEDDQGYGIGIMDKQGDCAKAMTARCDFGVSFRRPALQPVLKWFFRPINQGERRSSRPESRPSATAGPVSIGSNIQMDDIGPIPASAIVGHGLPPDRTTQTSRAVHYLCRHQHNAFNRSRSVCRWWRFRLASTSRELLPELSTMVWVNRYGLPR